MFPCFQHPGKQIVHFPFADIVLTLIYFCQCGGHHEVFIQAEVLVEVFVGFTIVVVRCLELIGKSFQQTGIQADVHVEALVAHFFVVAVNDGHGIFFIVITHIVMGIDVGAPLQCLAEHTFAALRHRVTIIGSKRHVGGHCQPFCQLCLHVHAGI